MMNLNCFAPKIQRIASMGMVLFRRNTGVFQGKNRSQRRETVHFGLMGFGSLLLYKGTPRVRVVHSKKNTHL
ncbi:MAG: hypothetical protein SOZ38_08535, partial [Oscillospiraceae bacterium]|nr:hypothetical protein [Oscillospiraceae bacterium]